jgi:hypothetical protein
MNFYILKDITVVIYGKDTNIYIYIYGEVTVLCKVKNQFLLWHEISYPDGLNGLSKLLNNLFMLKSCGILNFMIF